MLSDLLHRWRTVFQRRIVEDELDEELSFHVERQAEKLTRSGIPPDEALRRARIEFGGIEQVKEETRSSWGSGVFESFQRDLIYAFRGLRKNPGFTSAVVLSLSLGIAASTGLFAVLDALVLHPLPYAGAERLARVQLRSSSGPARAGTVTTEEFAVLRRASTLDAAYVKDGFTKTLAGASFPESLWTQYYTGNALPLLGIKPLIGRVFTEAEAPVGSPPQHVALLSQQFWQRHFAGQPSALGQTLRLDGESFTVIGVMPAEFEMDVTDVILPLSMTPDPNERWPVTVRVKAGASITAAEAELQQLYQRFAETRPDEFPRGFRIELRRLIDEERGSSHVPIVSVLFGAAALLLLIGCANVAILLLARGRHRIKELAVRQALGATRGRLVSLLLCETLLFTLAAAALAVLVVTQVLPILLDAAPGIVARRAGMIVVGPMAILFAMSATVLVTLAAGLWPALAVSRPRSDAIRDASAVRASTGRSRLGGAGIVAVQVGVAVVLLAGTGAAIRSLLELYRAPIGYDQTRVTTAQIYLPVGRYAAWPQRVALFERLRTEIATTASVEDSTLSLIPTGPPPTNGMTTRIDAEGLRGDEREVLTGSIASDYFSTLRIPLVRGRMWSASDDVRGEGVAVINETMARELWPNEDPIGKRVRDTSFARRRPQWILNAPGRDGWFEVIGVVRDTPNRGLREPIAPEMYYPYTAALSDVAVLIIRTKGNPAAAERDLRMAVSRADSSLPIIRFITPETFTGLRQEQFVTALLVGFGGAALLLASFGLFSVASYSIARRTREFGIRIALGASPRAVLCAALQAVVIAAAAGLGLGLLLSVALNSVLARWSIHNVDHPLVLAGVAGVLMAATLVATLIPGRRATRADPMTTLRAE